MQSIKRNSTVFFAAALLVTWSVLVCVRTSSASTRLQAQIARQRLTIARLDRRLADGQGLQHQIDRFDAATASLTQQLAPATDVNKTLRNFNQLAEASALQVFAGKSLKCLHHDGLAEQPFQLTVGGNFNSFYSFLLSSETLFKSMQVSQLCITQKPERDGYISAELTFSLFFCDPVDAPRASVE